jgi:uncharacterized protein YkwD
VAAADVGIVVRGFATVALAAVALAAATATPADARVESGGLVANDALEAQVLERMNALRRSRGLAPLRVSRGLRSAADAHSSAMLSRGFFSHSSADGSSFWRRVQRYYPRGRSGVWSVGENLLWSSPDVDASRAIQMWLNSPTHRRILLTARWREVGLSAVHASVAPGVYGGRPVTVLTADFGVRR